MHTSKIIAIKNWIDSMGFELVKSHLLNSKYTCINYYTLGNFGVFEAISKSSQNSEVNGEQKLKFISWDPWGQDFVVHSAKELSEAYQESLTFNPQLAG